MKPSTGNSQAGKASILGWVRNSASGVVIVDGIAFGRGQDLNLFRVSEDLPTLLNDFVGILG
jgi:hypothetical protein